MIHTDNSEKNRDQQLILAQLAGQDFSRVLLEVSEEINIFDLFFENGHGSWKIRDVRSNKSFGGVFSLRVDLTPVVAIWVRDMEQCLVTLVTIWKSRGTYEAVQ